MVSEGWILSVARARVATRHPREVLDDAPAVARGQRGPAISPDCSARISDSTVRSVSGAVSDEPGGTAGTAGAGRGA